MSPLVKWSWDFSVQTFNIGYVSMAGLFLYMKHWWNDCGTSQFKKKQWSLIVALLSLYEICLSTDCRTSLYMHTMLVKGFSVNKFNNGQMIAPLLLVILSPEYKKNNLSLWIPFDIEMSEELQILNIIITIYIYIIITALGTDYCRQTRIWYVLKNLTKVSFQYP